MNPKSPHHNATLIEQGVGIRFNGEERNDVEEYCISESWICVAVGNKGRSQRQSLTIKMTGKVEPYVHTAPAA